MSVRNNDQKAKARASALASLAMREHSVLELQQKLNHKGFQDDIVLELLAKLQQQNLLCNERFAEAYWRQRAAKGFGPIIIHHQLQLKGIDENLIQRSQENVGIDFYDIIKRVYAKKYRAVPWQDFKEKARRQGFLYRRGFSMDLIKTVLD